MITFRRFIILAYTCAFVFSITGHAFADQICGGHRLSTHLDLTMPHGCLSTELFRRQIDNPADLVTPQTETAPDLTRRLQTFSDWRTSRQTPQRSDERSE